MSGHMLLSPGRSSSRTCLSNAELYGGVEKNFVAILLGKREPEVGPPLIGNLQNAVGHFLRDCASWCAR